MWRRGHLLLVVLLACLAQNVSTRDEDTRAERKGKRRGGDTVARILSENEEAFQGKFSAKNQVQCTWIATKGQIYTLRVTCNPGHGERITCEFTGDPTTCPAYATNKKTYWKQISRSLKKQKELCTNNRALLRAAVCKHAHFRPSAPSVPKRIRPVQAKTVQTTTSTTVTIKAEHPESSRAVECTERSDHYKLAEEKCGNSWASFCTFIFTFIQSGDC